MGEGDLLIGLGSRLVGLGGDLLLYAEGRRLSGDLDRLLGRSLTLP